MKKQKQLAFEILERNSIKHFGGAYLSGNPKEKRPVSIRKAMHLVMRSLLARGHHSFLKNDRKITEIINTQARHFGVKVYRQANGGNHLHLIVLPSA